MPSDRDLVSKYSDDKTRLIEVERLVPWTNQTPRLKELIESIRERGMDYPLFAEPANAWLHRRLVARLGVVGRQWSEDLDYLIVFVGNQRLKAVQKLGYERVSVSVWNARRHGFYSELCLKCRGVGQTKWWVQVPSQPR